MTDPDYRHAAGRSEPGNLIPGPRIGLSALGLFLITGFFDTSMAGAGSISLTMTAAAQVQDDVLAVELTLRNGGDEAARSIVAALHFADQMIRSEVFPQLDPNDELNTGMTLPVGQLGNGRWPYRVAVSYADANGFPFHALLVGLAEAGALPPAEVAVPGFSPPAISGSGALQVPIRNVSATPREVDVTLYLPQGFEAARSSRSVKLAPWETREVSFSLVNRAGLAGSAYGIFVGAEYEDGEGHQTVVAPATLEIVSEQLFPRRLGPLMWLLCGLVIVVWAIYVALRRRTK